MNACPKCNYGRMIISVKQAGEKEFKDTNINCIHCDGIGKVSDEKLTSIKEIDKFMDNEMCHCDNPTFGSYPTDGQCDCGMWKHHVHCGNCGKISQIG